MLGVVRVQPVQLMLNHFRIPKTSTTNDLKTPEVGSTHVLGVVRVQPVQLLLDHHLWVVVSLGWGEGRGKRGGKD